MWVEWLEDEQRLMENEDQFKGVVELFERALHDYKYYQVCANYCDFIVKLYGSKKIDI